MKIKQEPPTDRDVAEAVALMQAGLVKDTPFLRDTLRLAHRLPMMNATDTTLDDHRTASTPPEPIAVHRRLGEVVT